MNRRALTLCDHIVHNKGVQHFEKMEDPWEDLLQMFEEHRKKQKEALKLLPESLSRIKKKFLIAINKASEEEFSEEDAQFVKKVQNDTFGDFNFEFLMHAYRSLTWDDSEASKVVCSILTEHGSFKLPKYIHCAKVVLLSYSGCTGANVSQLSECTQYVLTHARCFGNTAHSIFETTSESGCEDTIPTNPVLTSLPDSTFMSKIRQLMDDLQLAYDETKYRRLNANVTYITLLMLRRLVKNESQFAAAFKSIKPHDDYVKLCRYQLDTQLPKCNTTKLVETALKRSAFLAIHAYFNTEDVMTKRVLKVTCMQHMEWTGLQLPHLFFKVVELYGISEDDLWNYLSNNNNCILDQTYYQCVYESIAISLYKLTDEYYKKYVKLRDEPGKSQNWFPYCRVLNGDYHQDLSAKQNKLLCMLLAYLVDLKIGYDKSTVRLSHWAKSLPQKEVLEKVATKIYNKLAK